ncbi:N-acetylglucosamine-6-phosphate deacetylase [Oxobacter pfennigii]|uniref:N-acetylglucosamine-6-phosphate deacetylase n=1 Tax=Oxobacter pfennigii TaxID=36849 RepID=A0A0P8YY81_9CLOT|nr:N-acetylglucosamine-6-phosphate deacetylase [Oxobacter pfennigii]KPU44718.1 N-acetylglucosamine-6-phosphate deacetylase [Oxobacter pfennigii]
MLAVVNGKIIYEESIIEDKALIVDKSKILSINETVPKGIEVIDAEGNYISPGFIDMHIHGIGGYDTMDSSYEALNSMSEILTSFGVTSFMPTVLPMDRETIKKAIKAVSLSMIQGTEGANIIGVHLEGPFINKKMKGALDESFLHEPDMDLFLNIAGDGLPIIKRVTLAPELNGAIDLIKFLNGHGITVSIGHSDASFDETINAIQKGANHSTHLYNAMRPYNHREPGIIGAIMDSGITTELIADGVHVHFAALRTALKIKGYKNCALVSDSTMACCMEDGTYFLGGQEIMVKESVSRLKDDTLAGSTLTLDKAVRNIVKNTHLDITKAVYMASGLPAKICRLSDKKGFLKEGYDADLIIFDDDINIKTTLIGGVKK